MLAAEAEDAAVAGEQLPSLESATSPHLPAPTRQKQGLQQQPSISFALKVAVNPHWGSCWHQKQALTKLK